MLIDIMCIHPAARYSHVCINARKRTFLRVHASWRRIRANTPMNSHSQNFPQRPVSSSSAYSWQGPHDARTQSDHEAMPFSAHESAYARTRTALKPSPIVRASNEQPSRAYVTNPQNFEIEVITYQHVSPQKIDGPVTLKTMVDVPVDEPPSPSSQDSPRTPAVAKKSPTAQQTDR
jgi:hypothetical protein